MANQSFYGSMCLTDLIEHAKKNHSAFSKAENGKIYFNITTWLNEEKDEYGNVMSYQLNSQKDMAAKEGKIYIGNSKKTVLKPVTENDFPKETDFKDLSNRKKEVDNKGGLDDLPF